MPSSLSFRRGMAPLLLLCVLFFHGMAMAEETEQRREFTHFSLVLPPGWDGEEQKAFISDNPDEYLLVLGKKDSGEERFLAQVSIYLLPNRPGAAAEDAALTLAMAQADASKPLKEGSMWTFTGEPRSNVVKGRAKTLVNTDKDNMLIIIAQDPENLGADAILDSLSGNSGKARELLGR